MTRPRIVLVGAGAMGGIMARLMYPRLAGVVDLVGIVDRNGAKAAALAAEAGVPAFDDLAAAVDELAPDGADLRVPHGAHADAVEEALALGLHVLVEKPLATTAADVARVVRLAAASDRTVAVAENYPHLQATRSARDAIASGRIGELLAIRTTRVATIGGEWVVSGWRLGGGPDAGVLWDQGTHHTSLVRALGGEVVDVSARRTSAPASPGSDVVTIDLGLASGPTASSLYCWGSPDLPVEAEGLVLGTEGRIELLVDYRGTGGRAELVRPDGSRERLSGDECYYDSHAWIVEDWTDAWRAGRDPVVTVASAAADARVVLAAERSIRDGGPPVRIEAG